MRSGPPYILHYSPGVLRPLPDNLLGEMKQHLEYTWTVKHAVSISEEKTLVQKVATREIFGTLLK